MKVLGRQVQFSKAVVLMVLCAVTGMAALCLLWPGVRDGAQTEALFGHYTSFAGVVFAAYSGNSAVEKVVRSRSGEG